MLKKDKLLIKLLSKWPDILKSVLTNENVFPIKIYLGLKSRSDMHNEIDKIKDYIKLIKIIADKYRFELSFCTIHHRQLGRQEIPKYLIISNISSYLEFINKKNIFDEYTNNIVITIRKFPELNDWLLSNFLYVEKYSNEWKKILNLIEVYCYNPNPMVYVRELDIPGVDSKFIENNLFIIDKLLEYIFFKKRIEESSKINNLPSFCKKWGFKYQQSLIRFRLLDPTLTIITSGFSDLTITLSDFIKFNPPVKYVFITENKTNGLSFPNVSNSIIIFGLGYAIDNLSEVKWLQQKEIYYWGDIDTHGFEILARFRKYFLNVKSLLMSENILLKMKNSWAFESKKSLSEINKKFLTKEEFDINLKIINNEYGFNIRLEQERIPLDYLKNELSLLKLL